MDLVEKRTEQETVVVIHNCIALPAEKEQIYLRALSQKKITRFSGPLPRSKAWVYLTVPPKSARSPAFPPDDNFLFPLNRAGSSD